MDDQNHKTQGGGAASGGNAGSNPSPAPRSEQPRGAADSLKPAGGAGAATTPGMQQVDGAKAQAPQRDAARTPQGAPAAPGSQPSPRTQGASMPTEAAAVAGKAAASVKQAPKAASGTPQAGAPGRQPNGAKPPVPKTADGEQAAAAARNARKPASKPNAKVTSGSGAKPAAAARQGAAQKQASGASPKAGTPAGAKPAPGQKRPASAKGAAGGKQGVALKPSAGSSTADGEDGRAFKPKQVQPRQLGSQKLSKITLVAAVAAVLVAVIGWFATDGFGTNKLEPPQTEPASVVGQDPASSSAEPTGATTIDAQVAEKMAALTLEQKVSQMFIVTPEGLTGADTVVAAGDLTRIAIDDRPVGGIIYSTPNLLDATQVTEMLATTQSYSNEACGLPMFLAIDEEGGEVTRIGDSEGFDGVNVGNMSDIGATGDPAAAREAASTMGRYLTKLGFNLDFAPVADIANNPESETMLYRSFGTTAEDVAPMVTAAVQGFTDAGILSCAKHFPGIGAALGDSHIAGISTEKSLPEMQDEELVPFKEAIAAGVPFVMVGHISCPQVSGENTPASLSRGIVTDILRNQLGFNGLIITDSLAMGAINESYDASQVGVMAIQAGNDIILMPENFDATYRGVLDAIAAGEITEERINESVERIIKAKLIMKGA